MTAKVYSAKGVQGCLIYTDGDYQFRVYDKQGGFNDYDIHHWDLGLTIDDTDAEFYEYEDGTLILDHSRETLGK